MHQINIPLTCDFNMKYYFQNSKESCAAGKFPPHIHDSLEIYILLEGEASFMVERSLYKLRPMNIVITKPNEMHNCIFNSVSCHKYACFWFEPSNDFLFHDFLMHDFGDGNLCVPCEQDAQKIESLCRSLDEGSANGDKKWILCQALQLLYYIGKNLNAAPYDEVLPKLLRTILDDIHVNLCSIRSLSYFEEKYYIGTDMLNRLFQNFLRISPKVYIESKRLAYSRLLLERGMSVNEVCETAGFSDYSNYIRIFRTRFGVTPLQYRLQKIRGETVAEGKQP